ncbi:MAG: pyruvate dehydrogenase component [Planctomycetota bacterium]|jgi:pyruvate dehydrogenase E2 component (dihydrolipoamide acetyltransferase)
MAEFVMPSLGADMQEATLVKWRIHPGSHIKRGDVIGEVDTAKGVIDLECFQEGIVEKLVANEGQTIPVGAVMLLLNSDERKESIETDEQAILESVVSASSDRDVQQLQQDNKLMPTHDTQQFPLPSSVVVPTKASVERLDTNVASHIKDTTSKPADTEETKASERIKVSPLARRRAAELGIDLAKVSSAKLDGAIGVEDIERAAALHSTVSIGKDPESSRRALRTAIAAAMSKSKREIPHYYLQTSVDMSKALSWLEQENAQRSIADRLLPVVIMLKAVSRALMEVPQLNGYWVDNELHTSDRINIGFAIALSGGGLIAPAIHDVNTKSPDQLMVDLRELIPRARTGRLRSSEMTDATITITSLGDMGVESVTGIVYPPQVAIVGFGKILNRPWVESGELCVRPVVIASLSADHRATDGLVGARFLDALGRILQEPQSL